MTKVDTSNFALKTDVAEIKKKVYDKDVGKIDFVDELQGKNLFEYLYLYLNQDYKYFVVDTTNTKKILSWQSAGVTDETLEPIKNENSPSLLFEKTKPYLKIGTSKFLAQKKDLYP